MDWSIFLFIMKWIFLGLVYLVLLLLLIGVQREMRLRLPQAAPSSPGGSSSFGRLRIIRAGSDPRLRAGMFIPLKPEMSIGSLGDNDLVLRDRYISGHHASLRWDGVSWLAEDLNSTNGTFVNQQRINPGAPLQVPSGAILEVGDIAFEMMEA